MKSRWICKQCEEDLGKYVGNYYSIITCPSCGQYHVMTFYGLARGTEAECLEYLNNTYKRWFDNYGGGDSEDGEI